MPTAQQIQDAFRQYGNDKIKIGELVDQYRPNDSQLAQALGFTIPEVQAYLAESDRQRRAAFNESRLIPEARPTTPTMYGPSPGSQSGTGVDDRGFSLLAPGFWNGGQTTGWTGDPTQGSQTYSGDTAGLYQYYKDLGYTLAPDGTVTTTPRASMNEYDFPTGDAVQLRLANGNAGGFDPQGNIIDLGRKYDEGKDTVGQIAMTAAILGMGGIVGAHAGLLGSESLATLGGNTGADAFAEASIWDSIGADLATGWESSTTISSLQNAALSAGYTTEALAGLSAAELAALPEVANMIATGTSAAGTTMFPPGPGTQVGPLTPDIPGTQLPGVNPPVTPPTTNPPATTSPGNPRLPNSVFNPPGTNSIPNLANLIAGGADFGSSMYVADKYKEIFDQLLAKSDPFGGERSKYFPLVGDAVENAKLYNGLAFRGLNDPNFWTEQSWLKGIGDYSADATQRKLASQGYNYSGNTQHEVAKTLRDTMAQYVIPGQQNLISGANMAGNLVNTAGTLAGAQFNPAQAMGPLSNIATSGLNSFQNGIGSLFNNNGQPGQSLVEQGLGWLTNYWGDSSTRSTGSLTDGVNTSDYNNPDLDNWL